MVQASFMWFNEEYERCRHRHNRWPFLPLFLFTAILSDCPYVTFPLRKIVRKSTSLNSLDDNNATKSANISPKKFGYRYLAALPNIYTSGNHWRYPTPQTEIIIEGRGNLSNTLHRDSITRGMKPASHQTCLSTSQTNLCALLGTVDLIKSSSRSSLQKNKSSNSLNRFNRCPPKDDDTPKMFSSHRPELGESDNPMTKISDLIKKYENSVVHPYSSSNCSTPKIHNLQSPSDFNSPIASKSNKSISSKGSSKSSALSPIASSNIIFRKKSFFKSFLMHDKSDWSTTTEEEDFKNHPTFLRRPKPKLFGDITNSFKQNIQ